MPGWGYGPPFSSLHNKKKKKTLVLVSCEEIPKLLEGEKKICGEKYIYG